MYKKVWCTWIHVVVVLLYKPTALLPFLLLLPSSLLKLLIIVIQKFCCHGNVTSHFSSLLSYWNKIYSTLFFCKHSMISRATAKNRCYFSTFFGRARSGCWTWDTRWWFDHWSGNPSSLFSRKKRIPDRRSFPCLFLSWVPQALPPLRASRAKISPVMQTTKEQYISPFDGIFFFYITDQCFDIFPQSRFGSYSAPLFLCNNGRWHWWYTPTICWLLYFCHWKLTPLLIHSPIMCQSLWPGLSAMLLMC